MPRMTRRFLYSTSNLSHHHTPRYISILVWQIIGKIIVGSSKRDVGCLGPSLFPWLGPISPRSVVSTSPVWGADSPSPSPPSLLSIANWLVEHVAQQGSATRRNCWHFYWVTVDQNTPQWSQGLKEVRQVVEEQAGTDLTFGITCWLQSLPLYLLILFWLFLKSKIQNLSTDLSSQIKQWSGAGALPPPSPGSLDSWVVGTCFQSLFWFLPSFPFSSWDCQ